MISTTPGSRDRNSRSVAASLLVHLLLVTALAHRSRVWVAPVRLPGTAKGTRMVLTYLPGSAPSSAPAVARAITPRRLIPARSKAQSILAKPLDAQPAGPPRENPGNGIDALGEGDASIALMEFFPDPRPDLSRLPHGIRGDVVLEAIIDADGHIAQLTVKQGVGYGVDESVIATVEQWTFHPAMRDGKPVASQQEFHFHYERG